MTRWLLIVVVFCTLQEVHADEGTASAEAQGTPTSSSSDASETRATGDAAPAGGPEAVAEAARPQVHASLDVPRSEPRSGSGKVGVRAGAVPSVHRPGVTYLPILNFASQEARMARQHYRRDRAELLSTAPPPEVVSDGFGVMVERDFGNSSTSRGQGPAALPPSAAGNPIVP